MAQIKGGLFSKGGGNNGGVGFPVIEISLAQIDGGNFNFTEDQFNQIMACGNFTLKLPDGTFYNFVGSNNSQQASVFFYAIRDNQTVSPTELTILQLSIVKSTYVGTISPNVYTNGGGGKQLYQHNLQIVTNDGTGKKIYVQIVNDNNVAFDYIKLATFLYDKGFTDTLKLYQCTGCMTYAGYQMNFYGMCNDNARINIQGFKIDGAQSGDIINSSTTYSTFKDTIIEL